MRDAGRSERVGSSLVVFVLLLTLAAGSLIAPASADHTHFHAPPHWGSPVLLEASDEDSHDPRVAMDSAGNAVAVWHTWDGVQGNIWANRFAPTSGWSVPTLLAESAYRSDVAMGADGSAIVVWSQLAVSAGDPSPIRIYASRYFPGAGWDTPTLISAPDGENIFARVAIDGLGNAIAVWWDRGIQFGVWANRFTLGLGWGSPTRIEIEASVLASPPKIAVDGAGNAFVVYDCHGCEPHPVFVSRHVPGVGWEAPIEVAATTAGHGSEDIAVDSAGNAMLVWPQCDETLYCQTFSIWGRRYVVGLGWQDAVRIEGNDTKLAIPARVAINDEGAAIAVWTQGEAGRAGLREIHANRFVPGAGWGVPVLLSSGQDIIADLEVTMDPDGNGIAVWVQHDGTGRLDPPDQFPTRAEVWSSRFLAETGWGPATPIEEGFSVEVVTRSDPFGVELSMDPRGRAIAVWQQIEAAERRSIWAAAYGSLAEELQRDLKDTRDELAATQDELAASQETLSGVIRDLEAAGRGLEDARADLSDSRGAMAALEASFVTLLWFQAAFAASIAVLLLMYWNLRRRNPIHGGRPSASPHKGAVPGQAIEANSASPSMPVEAGSARPHPWPRTTGPLRLTTKERALLHLLDLAQYGDSPEVPLEMTPSEIALAIGIDRRHLSQYVSPLQKEGLVRGRTARVRGALQRRKVYALTDSGKSVATGIGERIRTEAVRVRDAGGVRPALIGDILAGAHGFLSILDLVRQSIQEGIVDLEDPRGTGDQRGV